MSHTLEELLITALNTPIRDLDKSPDAPWGLPVNLSGLVGAAKSQRIAQVASALSWPCEVLLPAGLMPESFGGAPRETPDGWAVDCILPAANRLLKMSRGILFIDELSTARPAVQAAALGVVEDRRIGDQKFSPGIRILTAMNPPEYAASGYSLEVPMANRLVHINYEVPTVEEWGNYLLNGPTPINPKYANAEEQVRAGWTQNFSRISVLAYEFLRKNHEYLHDQPKQASAQSGAAWPSLRTWERAILGMTASRCLGMPMSVDLALLQGCVGETYVAPWIAWLDQNDLPDPEDVVYGRWRPDPRRLDITSMALSSTTQWVVKMKDKDLQMAAAQGLWVALHNTIEGGNPDLVVMHACKLINNTLGASSQYQPLKEIATTVIRAIGSNNLSKHLGYALDVS